MNDQAAAMHLERLRRLRNRPPRDLNLPVAAQVEQLRRSRRTSGGRSLVLGLLPEGLRPAVTSIHITSRTIKVAVRDDGARYAVDRCLRGHARSAMLEKVGARDVRVVVGPPG